MMIPVTGAAFQGWQVWELLYSVWNLVR